MTITHVDLVRMHVVTSADESFVPDTNEYLKVVQEEETLLEAIKAQKREEYAAKIQKQSHRLVTPGLNLRVDCDCGVKGDFVQVGFVEGRKPLILNVFQK